MENSVLKIAVMIIFKAHVVGTQGVDAKSAPNTCLRNFERIISILHSDPLDPGVRQR